MAYLQSIASMLAITGVLLASAGRFDLAPIWEYLALFAVSGVAGSFFVDPDLMRERWRPGGKRMPAGYGLLALLALAHLGLAGLDLGRYHWSDTVPGELRVGALAALAVSFAVLTWAMHVNPFFSSVVRIQSERGHKLIREGPYRIVRHPGYAAALVACLASGLALGSWLAALSGYVFVPMLLYRTLGEDRLLRRELPGYEDYAQQVRYRVAPGIW